MTRTEREIQAELQIVEQYAAAITRRLEQIQGHRDQLIRELTDNEGAASNRWAVR
jgi:hypothetical protein